MNNKIITYSLLAHIRNNSSFIEGPIDIFIPLIKKTLSSLNSEGKFKGENVNEIRCKALDLYGVDFPIPVLVKILQKIGTQINTDEETFFHINQDGSFELRNYSFEEYDEIVENLSSELKELESFFMKFKSQFKNKAETEFSSVIEFIDQNKDTISKYLGNENSEPKIDSSFISRFIQFTKNIPPLFELIKRLYLGSLLSSFVEYKTDDVKTDIELLLDTNFIIGLLDLNTKESTHTCNKLVDIAVKRKMKLSVLSYTLNETEGLIRGKAKSLNKSFLVSKINAEDIYNACERRNLNRADLERIADNLENELQKIGVNIVYEPKKYRNLAKNSKEYEHLKPRRNTKFAALHDATAIYYVRDKRGKRIRNFEDVNCWFLNNSSNLTRYQSNETNTKFDFQPETVKVDDLLNLLWLSNPELDSDLSSDDLTEIGLNSMLSLAINRSLPSAKMISELEDNILKYGQEEISDNDVILLSKRISQNQISSLDKLNEIAKSDPKKFIANLHLEANKQRQTEEEIYKKMSDAIDQLMSRSDSMNKEIEKSNKISSENKELESSNKNLKSQLEAEQERTKNLENKIREPKRIAFIKRKLLIWRMIPFAFIIGSIICVLLVIQYHYYNNELSFIETLKDIYKNEKQFPSKCICGFSLLVLNIFGFNMLYHRFFDDNKIDHFKDRIQVPDEIKEL